MAKKEKKTNNLRLALLFTGFIIFVILVSIVFKTVDVLRTSKFDGDNRFTVALFYKGNVDYLSVSPQEGTISKLSIEGVNGINRLGDYEVPADVVLKAKKEISGGPKNQFAGLFFRKRSIEGGLTIFDVFNLWFTTRKVSNEKILTEKAASTDLDKIEDVASTAFIDPKVSEAEESVTVTNTTKTPGLGNKIANYATNLGANVILVNTSRDEARESKIYYKTHSYTVDKLSRILGIPTEQRNDNSISDIIVVIGRDF